MDTILHLITTNSCQNLDNSIRHLILTNRCEKLEIIIQKEVPDSMCMTIYLEAACQYDKPDIIDMLIRNGACIKQIHDYPHDQYCGYNTSFCKLTSWKAYLLKRYFNEDDSTNDFGAFCNLKYMYGKSCRHLMMLLESCESKDFFRFNTNDRSYDFVDNLRKLCIEGDAEKIISFFEENEKIPCMYKTNYMHYLCYYGNSEVVSYYLNIIDPSQDYLFGIDITPVMWACIRGHIDIVKMFISKKAVSNNYKLNPLDFACMANQPEIVRFLINSGHYSIINTNVYSYIVEMEYLDIIGILHEYSVDYNKEIDIDGTHPLLTAAGCRNSSLKYMLDKGMYIQTPEWMTDLIVYACIHGNFNNVKALIPYEKYLINDCIDESIYNNDPEILEYLLDKGAGINYTSSLSTRESRQQHAEKNGYHEILEILTK